MTRDPAVGSGRAGATAYSVQGQGEPVVLVHGVGMAREVWAPQAAALARDYQVISYDLMGHGESELPPEGVSLADYAGQLLALLDHLGIPAANVVGHSMGALVALEFSLRHPERTLRLAALNAVFQRTPEQRAAVEARAATLQRVGPGATVGLTIDRWFGTPVPAELRAAADLTASLLRRVNPLGYARTYQLFARSDRVHAERLPALAMPVLFMTGEGDLNSSPAMSQAMARLVPGARLDVLPDARHMMNLTHPQRVNDALRAFLAGGAG
jgi:pimeloyl-ACP methyl ester carboxylesterase